MNLTLPVKSRGYTPRLPDLPRIKRVSTVSTEGPEYQPPITDPRYGLRPDAMKSIMDVLNQQRAVGVQDPDIMPQVLEAELGAESARAGERRAYALQEASLAEGARQSDAARALQAAMANQAAGLQESALDISRFGAELSGQKFEEARYQYDQNFAEQARQFGISSDLQQQSQDSLNSYRNTMANLQRMGLDNEMERFNQSLDMDKYKFDKTFDQHVDEFSKTYGLDRDKLTAAIDQFDQSLKQRNYEFNTTEERLGLQFALSMMFNQQQLDNQQQQGMMSALTALPLDAMSIYGMGKGMGWWGGAGEAGAAAGLLGEGGIGAGLEGLWSSYGAGAFPMAWAGLGGLGGAAFGQSSIGRSLGELLGFGHGGESEHGAISGGLGGAGLGFMAGGPLGALLGGGLGSLFGSDLLGGCIIVTAATGKDSPEVDVTREYRDKFLTKEQLRGYYMIAEQVVPYMKQDDGVRRYIRDMLVEPLIEYGRWKLGKGEEPNNAIKVITEQFLDACQTAGEARESYIRYNGEVV